MNHVAPATLPSQTSQLNQSVREELEWRDVAIQNRKIALELYAVLNLCLNQSNSLAPHAKEAAQNVMEEANKALHLNKTSSNGAMKIYHA